VETIIRLLICLSLLPLAGCAGLGWVTDKLSPPPTVDAKYELPNVPTLVLVENYHDSGALAADCETLTRFIVEDLQGQKRKKDGKDTEEPLVVLVDWKKANDLRNDDPKKYHDMKISELGKTVGAKQVIYVQLLYSELQGAIGGDLLRGRAGARVRVVDCATGETKWPQGNAGGEPVAYETDLKQTGPETSATQIRQQTLEAMGQSVGGLFHERQMAQ